MILVRRSCGSSSPSPAENQAPHDGVDSSVLLADEDKMISAGKDGSFQNQYKDHITVEEEGNIDEDEDEDEDEGEGEDEEHREGSTRIFEIEEDEGEGVWESKFFSRWWKQNWACFYYTTDDYFYRLPKDYFKPGEDPRSRTRSFRLKMGHSLVYYKNPKSCPFTEDPSLGARLAIQFYNKENKMGKTLKFESLSKVSAGVRFCEPFGYVYFLTFVATETDSGLEREFQASLFQHSKNKNIWYLRALREKPYVF